MVGLVASKYRCTNFKVLKSSNRFYTPFELAYSVGTHSIKPGSTEAHPTLFPQFREQDAKFQPCTESPSEV